MEINFGLVFQVQLQIVLIGFTSVYNMKIAEYRQMIRYYDTPKREEKIVHIGRLDDILLALFVMPATICVLFLKPKYLFDLNPPTYVIMLFSTVTIWVLLAVLYVVFPALELFNEEKSLNVKRICMQVNACAFAWFLTIVYVVLIETDFMTL